MRQQNGQTTRYWYVLDGQGNVVAVTDVNGPHAGLDRYAYDPWGEGLPEGTSESVPQPLRYRAYWWDGALGWYWLATRSPTTPRAASCSRSHRARRRADLRLRRRRPG